ncbi:hypothetical protein LTR74_003364 [Friedmanniomyces endolithicus]|nr:hypothetical protein LTR74_003364 [Friedmanniomyces endolithicus]
MATSSRQEFADFVRTKILPFVKSSATENPRSHGGRVVRGLLHEAWVFELLQSLGILAIKAYETAPVDGAFLRGTPPEEWIKTSALDRLLWAERAGQAQLLPFDVKYYEYITDRKGQHYAFRPTTREQRRNVALYVLVFQDLDDYVGLVPRIVWDESTDFAYDTLPLTLQIMAWCSPFMVHLSHLREAIQRILVADSEHWYCNPTTGVVLEGWLPGEPPPQNATQVDPGEPPLQNATQVDPGLATALDVREASQPTNYSVELFPVPGNSSAQAGLRNSIAAVREMWRDIKAAQSAGLIKGIDVDLNPVSPLICDFILNIAGMDESIRIEHKMQSATGPFTFGTGPRSPFAKNRLWHFLVCHWPHRSGGAFWCFQRGKVDASWSELTHVPDEYQDRGVLFHGQGALVEMLKFIQQHAAAAIVDAEQILAQANPGDMTAETLLKSDANPLDDAGEDDVSTGALQERKLDARGLPWLFSDLLEQCCEDGTVGLVSLDLGHPWTHCAAVKLPQEPASARPSSPWAEAMSRFPFDPQLATQPALPLRLCDWAGGAKLWGEHGKQFFPIAMKRRDWLQPIKDTSWWSIGSLLKRKEAQVFDSYVLLPSTHTSQSKYEVRQKTPVPERCAKYFLKQASLVQYQISQPTSLVKSQKDAVALSKGSIFLDRKDVEPLNHIIKLGDGSVFRHIKEALSTDPPDMSIQPHPENPPNPTFAKVDFITTLQAIHQAAWDHGRTYRVPLPAV